MSLQAYTPEEWLQSIPKVTRYLMIGILGGLVLCLVGVFSLQDLVFHWPFVRRNFQARLVAVVFAPSMIFVRRGVGCCACDGARVALGAVSCQQLELLPFLPRHALLPMFCRALCRV